jgi:hypothetical protein
MVLTGFKPYQKAELSCLVVCKKTRKQILYLTYIHLHLFLKKTGDMFTELVGSLLIILRIFHFT